MRENRKLKVVDGVIGRALCLLLAPVAGCVDRLRSWRPSTSEPARVLVIKLGAFGDLALMTPMLRALRGACPDAAITLLSSGRHGDVVAGCPHVDRVVRAPLEECASRPAAALPFVRWLRGQRFDLVVDAEQWMRLTALLSWLSGARRRVGFRTRGQLRHYLFTDTVSPRRNRHEVEHFLDLTRLVGGRTTDSIPRLWLTDAQRQRARDALGEAGRPLVAIHPGCGATGGPRAWPAEHYVDLIRRVTDSGLATVLLTGTGPERALLEDIAGRLAFSPLKQPADFGILEFAALLECCDLLVCGNTGAMHLAAAVGTSTVALHGPTNPRKWGPVGKHHRVIQSDIPCSPCLELGFEYGCKTHPCMALITVDRVFHEVVAALSEIGAEGEQVRG